MRATLEAEPSLIAMAERLMEEELCRALKDRHCGPHSRQYAHRALELLLAFRRAMKFHKHQTQ